MTARGSHRRFPAGPKSDARSVDDANGAGQPGWPAGEPLMEVLMGKIIHNRVILHTVC